MPAKKQWHELRPVDNATQQLGYLLACQEWFANSKMSGAAVERAEVCVVAADSGGCLPTFFYDTRERVHIGSSQVTACAACGALTPASRVCAVPLNPFSSVSCLQCDTCGG